MTDTKAGWAVTDIVEYIESLNRKKLLLTPQGTVSAAGTENLTEFVAQTLRSEVDKAKREAAKEAREKTLDAVYFTFQDGADVMTIKIKDFRDFRDQLLTQTNESKR